MIHWPIAALELATPRLRMRLPSARELDELANLATAGIHDPETPSVRILMANHAPVQTARRVMEHHWSSWMFWKPKDWRLTLAVFLDGTAIGTQVLAAEGFTTHRQVKTLSWLGKDFQDPGLAVEMRAAVLHLAFAGLGAREAVAFVEKTGSPIVSRKLGYRDDGVEHFPFRGENMAAQRLRLSRADWEAHRRTEVGMERLEPCLPMFGLPAAEGPGITAPDHR